jgi:zinc protease
MKKLLMAMLFAGATALGGDTHLSVPYTRFRLPNGLDVVLHVDRSLPTVAVNIWYRVGSACEKPGRTGFAHLFEHIMFEGSKDVPEGKFDEWLEAVGGDNNASTNTDRTNYFENVPSNALALPLFLESDRMGFLVDEMNEEKVDGQRDVVKNERRQSYENRPYGMASIVIDEQLFPDEYPYHWPTIGSMEDLSAASFDDVVEFFRTYYTPGNASLVIAGDIDPNATRAMVEHWFSDVPAGKPVPPLIPEAAPVITEEKRLVREDKVQLPRLYMAWITPALYAPGDAQLDLLSSVLAAGKNSRLYKRLVYDLQIAQDVSAFQWSRALCSEFQIIVTARPGHTLTEIETAVEKELAAVVAEGPTQHEVERAVNQFESSFFRRLESVATKADMLNGYLAGTGDPDYFNEDLARYRAIDPDDIASAAGTYLRDGARVVLSIVPEGKTDLAALKEAK